MRELARNDRAAVTVDEEDRPQLRQRVDDLLQALVQPRLVLPDGVVGHAAHDLVDLGDGALDGLKDLERVLVKDIERAFDPIIGDGVFVAARRRMRTAGSAGRHMPPSSAAAVELLIAERNASRIISRFSGSDDKHLGHSHARPQAPMPMCHRLSAQLCAHFAAMLSRVGHGRRSTGVS